MAVLDDVKTLLNGNKDDKLDVIERRTTERLCGLCDAEEIPPKLEFILFEVTMKRFNRIGNEGMTSYSQEGLTMAFPDSDFDEYSSEISAWKALQDDSNGFGRFRLL